MTDQSTGRSPRVAATVVTHNRCDVLRGTLTALLTQTRPLDEIFVVDNASTDGTTDMVDGEFPSVRLVRMAHNAGPGGGYAEGMRRAVAAGHDWVWVFNDDDTADEGALAAMLEAAAGLPPRAGILGCGRRDARGGMITLGARWKGRYLPVTRPADGDAPVALDVLAFSGSLVSSALVHEVGVPKHEYFIMFEELEYCLRARRAGWGVYALPRPLVTALALGSDGQAPPWRGYYQTRNQLAMTLQHRSLSELWWWTVRNARFCAVALLTGDRPAERLRMRAQGAWHALRGVSGRTVQPVDDVNLVGP